MIPPGVGVVPEGAPGVMVDRMHQVATGVRGLTDGVLFLVGLPPTTMEALEPAVLGVTQALREAGVVEARPKVVRPTGRKARGAPVEAGVVEAGVAPARTPVETPAQEGMRAMQ